jgi:hypothetical protein
MLLLAFRQDHKHELCMNLGAENAALHDWIENGATKQWSKNNL